MAKKKSCQNVRVPRVLSVAKRELYGWVDEENFYSALGGGSRYASELRREMRLTVDRAAEGHYVLPLTNFQREVLSRCRVAASQLHLNGWGFLRTFERVCLHFGFRPSWRVFIYSYQSHAPPPGKGFMSFHAYQGRKLFDSFEESIQEFKWHFFKVLPLPGKRPFWLDDEGAPFPWVYCNAEVGDFHVTELDPLETLAFEFLQSLPAGLGKKSNFKCRWILDHNDADVGAFIDSLLKGMEKQSRFDRLMQKMKEAEGAGPRSILPSSKAQTTASGASASGPAAPSSILAAAVAPAPSSGASKAAGKPMNATAAKPFSVEREEGVREDPAADLRQKRWKRKVSEASAEEAALGCDSAWKHKVNPIDHAFPSDYNFRAALDVGLTNGPIREILGPLVPEQLLGTAQFLACHLTACLQVGVENTFAVKVQLEKELAAAKEQSLTEELERAEGERLSATERMEEVERKAKVQAAELESCHSALVQEGKKVESLSQSLKGKQTALDEAEVAAAHWCDEWRSLAEETGEMVQQTFEILMDQVRHLNPAIDYSMITLDTRWDPRPRGFIILRLRPRVSRSLWWRSRNPWPRSSDQRRLWLGRSGVERWSLVRSLSCCPLGYLNATF
ncbi:hypothetical protein PIB30_069243 [Stylosanthes scabra]|uniref:Transposase (Putative), gypsy type n=1 Tax=Stylosanthes scabra TaxID=79078 RepID=A0ABU6WMQ6_9FABA|nr:hypothetical protein [Stylosanthes scabra]